MLFFKYLKNIGLVIFKVVLLDAFIGLLLIIAYQISWIYNLYE